VHGRRDHPGAGDGALVDVPLDHPRQALQAYGRDTDVFWCSLEDWHGSISGGQVSLELLALRQPEGMVHAWQCICNVPTI